jgi:2'-5' RNA ligase
MDNLEIQEYGIVLIPETNCINIAQTLNQKIAGHLPHFANIINKWHITLYHGAYNKKDIPRIKAAISAFKPCSFLLQMTDFYSTNNQWVSWGVNKTDTIQKLHEYIVYAISSYRQRPINRELNEYNTLSAHDKKQIDQYGISKVLEHYNPHLTLFYAPYADLTVPSVLPLIKNERYQNITCKVAKIIIGVLGYNGNITKIVASIPLVK